MGRERARRVASAEVLSGRPRCSGLPPPWENKRVGTFGASLAFGLLLACGSDGSDGECLLDAGLACSECDGISELASLEIGGGTYTTGFVELEDGDELRVTLGPAGGLALFLSFRARGIYPGKEGPREHRHAPLSRIELFLEGESVGLRLGGGVLTDTDQGAERLEAGVLFYSDELWPEILGQTLTVRAEISDECGNFATDELNAVAAEL